MMGILELKGLGKNFGKNVAVNAIDLSIKKGQIRGLIGPNGSGKTTIFNLISGFIQPSRGRVYFQGEDITDLPPHIVAKKGIARTFQLAALYKEITVLENVIMACHLHVRATLWEQFWRNKRTRREESEIEDKALDLLEVMGILEIKNEIAGDLPHGHQAALGIANVLATEPKLIMLDEPVSGMNPIETAQTMERIQKVRDRGITVFLVEHDMKAVTTTCDEITCINFGNKLTEGIPDDVCRHPEVIEAYLGGEINTC